MLTNLNHLTLAVSDIAKSFDFYRNTLGFVPKARWNKGAYLALGDLWLCLSLDIVSIKNDYTHYAFSITADQIEDFREKLNAEDIIQWKNNGSEGESIYFLDPDGHRLEVHCGDLQSRLQSCKDNPYDGMKFY